jgi:hypothetical protein
MCRMNRGSRRRSGRAVAKSSGGRIIGKFAGPGPPARGRLCQRTVRRRRPQQPHELGGVEPVAAHHYAVEQQYRDVEAVAAPENRIGINVDELERRQNEPAGEHGELLCHGLAQLAVMALDQREARGRSRLRGHRRQRRVAAGVVPTAGGAGSSALTWVAKKRTVAGGTSPTAVIL